MRIPEDISRLTDINGPCNRRFKTAAIETMSRTRAADSRCPRLKRSEKIAQPKPRQQKLKAQKSALHFSAKSA
jgi:hypothetical protein